MNTSDDDTDERDRADRMDTLARLWAQDRRDLDAIDPPGRMTATEVMSHRNATGQPERIDLRQALLTYLWRVRPYVQCEAGLLQEHDRIVMELERGEDRA